MAMKFEDAKIRAAILKALAHPVRVLIVDELTRGDRCVMELNKLANIDQSCLSRHLAILKNAGIISDRRAGVKTYYHLDTPCILRAFECALDVMRENLRRRQKAVRTGGSSR